MPQKKKASTNKKKNKTTKGGGGGGGAQVTKLSGKLSSLTKPLPVFHAGERISDNDPNINTTHAGIYQQYKTATARFRDGLRKLCNLHLLRSSGDDGDQISLDSVSDLSRVSTQLWNRVIYGDDSNRSAIPQDNPSSQIGADLQDLSLCDNPTNPTSNIPMNIEIPKEILNDLNTSIKLRSDVGKRLKEKNDEGHQYMIDSLKFCRVLLRQIRQVTRIRKAWKKMKMDGLSEDDLTSQVGGRFHALLEELGDDSDDQEQEDDDVHIDPSMVRENRIPRTQPPKEPNSYYSIDDLVNGDDRFQAMAFLTSVDHHMSLVGRHYELLKLEMQKSHRDKGGTSYLQLLLECTAATNMAIESVCSMEAALASDRPHLSSLYDVLAVVFMHPVIQSIDQLIQDPKLREKKVAHAFVGDIIATAFHNKGNQTFYELIDDFSRKNKVDHVQVKTWAETAKMGVDFEVQLARNERQDPGLNNQMSFYTGGSGMSSHSWLPHFYTGGDRSILNTQNILQRICDISEYNNALISNGGYFGKLWDEDKNPARRIRGDMDELVAGAILPELIEWCKPKHCPLRSMPHCRDLFTLPFLLNRHFEKVFDSRKNKNTRPAVPMSLSFAVHAMLTSMITLQGNGDVKRLRNSAKKTYEKLFQQIEEVEQSDISSQVPSLYSNTSTFKNLKLLPTSLLPPSYASPEITFWNPLMAGQFLLYAINICSIGLGSATVDCIGQLRLTLHVYNALQQNNIISESECQDLELLNILDSAFSKTRAVWLGSHSTKGNYSSRFFQCWGYSPQSASKLAKLDKFLPKDMPGKLEHRKLDEILPEQYSASYKHLVVRDFSEDVDDYSVINCTPKYRQGNKDFLDLISRVNMTRDSMDVDEYNVIPINFTKVGVILTDFIQGLMKSMGLGSEIDSQVAKFRASQKGKKSSSFRNAEINFRYQKYAHYVGMILASLDSDNASIQFDIHSAVVFLKDFFKNLSSDSYKFFVIE